MCVQRSVNDIFVGVLRLFALFSVLGAVCPRCRCYCFGLYDVFGS